MKRILTFSAIVIMAISCLSSCSSVARASMSSQKTSEVKLTRNNFKVIGKAYGTYTATYFLGIGGLSKPTAATNAIANMYENAALMGPQAVIDITTSQRSTSYLGIVNKIEYTASGTVIEFTD